MIKKIKQKLINIFSKKNVDISKKIIPCISCGACCAYFKVSFQLDENIRVPKKYIQIKNNIGYMKGAETFKGRCESMIGKIGENCSCSIYENRPNVCEDFSVWLPNGKQNPRCIKAREFHGLVGKISC